MSNFGLGVMIDCSRGAVMNVPSLKRFIDLLSKMGYKALQLYTEDTYEIPEEPYFGYLRGKYTQKELREVDAYAAARGVELIPCIQTLAHLDAIVRWDRFRPIVDINNILLAEDEGTYQLIEEMFSSIEATFSSRRIHIGMDEAHMVGLGKYLDKHGYQNRAEILLRHLSRVTEIAARHGFRPIMWSDMFFELATGGGYRPGATFSPEVLDKVPENLDLVYWDYYRLDPAFYEGVLRVHQNFHNPIIFAGGLWTWRGFAPMTRSSLRTTDAALEACRKTGVRDIFFTLWGDDGGECSYFSALPMLFYASRALDGAPDPEKLREEFREITGEDYDRMTEMSDVNLPSDTAPFSNSSKVWLYQDPFLGLFDRTVPPDAPARLEAVADRLEASAAESPTCGDLYRLEAAFARAAARKCDIGVRTRAAYRAGDRAALLSLAEVDYPRAREAVDALHRAFEMVWFSDNKPNGYELHDTRLGGLSSRISTCAARLAAYASGALDSLPELEEDILPAQGGKDNLPDLQEWARIAFPYGRAGH